MTRQTNKYSSKCVQAKYVGELNQMITDAGNKKHSKPRTKMSVKRDKKHTKMVKGNTQSIKEEKNKN